MAVTNIRVYCSRKILDTKYLISRDIKNLKKFQA